MAQELKGFVTPTSRSTKAFFFVMQDQDLEVEKWRRMNLLFVTSFSNFAIRVHFFMLSFTTGTYGKDQVTTYSYLFTSAACCIPGSLQQYSQCARSSRKQFGPWLTPGERLRRQNRKCDSMPIVFGEPRASSRLSSSDTLQVRLWFKNSQQQQ